MASEERTKPEHNNFGNEERTKHDDLAEELTAANLPPSVDNTDGYDEEDTISSYRKVLLQAHLTNLFASCHLASTYTVHTDAIFKQAAADRWCFRCCLKADGSTSIPVIVTDCNTPNRLQLWGGDGCNDAPTASPLPPCDCPKETPVSNLVWVRLQADKNTSSNNHSKPDVVGGHATSVVHSRRAYLRVRGEQCRRWFDKMDQNGGGDAEAALEDRAEMTAKLVRTCVTFELLGSPLNKTLPAALDTGDTRVGVVQSDRATTELRRIEALLTPLVEPTLTEERTADADDEDSVVVVLKFPKYCHILAVWSRAFSKLYASNRLLERLTVRNRAAVRDRIERVRAIKNKLDVCLRILDLEPVEKL